MAKKYGFINHPPSHHPSIFSSWGSVEKKRQKGPRREKKDVDVVFMVAWCIHKAKQCVYIYICMYIYIYILYIYIHTIYIYIQYVDTWYILLNTISILKTCSEREIPILSRIDPDLDLAMPWSSRGSSTMTSPDLWREWPRGPQGMDFIGVSTMDGMNL